MCNCSTCKNEPNDTITVSFSYTDEYNHHTELSKTVPSDYLDMSEMDILLELFTDFLSAAGFTYVRNGEIKFIKPNKDK